MQEKRRRIIESRALDHWGVNWRGTGEGQEARVSEDRRLKACVERQSEWGQGVMRDAFEA